MTTIAPEVAGALSRASGLDLSAYRPEHVAERIRRGVEREKVADEGELARLLRSDPAARGRFRRSVAVSVSGLFRDPAQFDYLEREVLPGLLAGTRRLRVWSAGCADGTELYTVALLVERLGALDRSFFLGSDVLEENVAKARAGVYDGVDGALRARLRWEVRDLVREPAPPGRWSLIVCRNLAIYLAPHAKDALHARLAGALMAGGVLLLGRSERLADSRSIGLEPIAPHAYRRSS